MGAVAGAATHTHAHRVECTGLVLTHLQQLERSIAADRVNVGIYPKILPVPAPYISHERALQYEQHVRRVRSHQWSVRTV